MQKKAKWKDIRKVVKNLQGKAPDSEHAVKNAVRRVSNAGPKRVNPPQTLPDPSPNPPKTFPKRSRIDKKIGTSKKV